MRKFAKILAVLAATVLALAFVGCKNDDDDDDGPGVVTEWSCTKNAGDGVVATMTFYFYDDNSFKLEGTNGSETLTAATGTYSGDTTKDGEIKLTVKKIAKSFIDGSETTELIDCPADQSEMSVEINGTKLTFLEMEFTKK